MASEDSKYDANQKHPKIEYKGKYPNLIVTQGVDGYQIIRSIEPGQESFFEIFPSGNYRGVGPKGEQVEVTVDKKHEYNADGKSVTTDGHHDEKTGGSYRKNVDGGSSQEVAGNQYQGGGGVVISGSQSSHIHSVTSGDHFQTTEGDVTTDHTGNVHHNITGDFVQFTTGHRVESVVGEYSINNQTGNFDVQTDVGKTRIFSGDKMLIKSSTEIKLNVDQSIITMKNSSIKLEVGDSFILITPAGIELKGARIDLNK